MCTCFHIRLLARAAIMCILRRGEEEGGYLIWLDCWEKKKGFDCLDAGEYVLVCV